ncbi:MAG: glutamate synthase, partial [Planctomycetota bacterium]
SIWIEIDASAERLKNFFEASVGLMSVLARACGHAHLNEFAARDLVAWKKDMADLTGVRYVGVV